MIRACFGYPLLAVLLLVCCTSQALCQIMVSSDEIWDGVSNPHSGDGVMLAGGVYTIPDELVIGSGVTLFLNDNATRFDDPANVPTGSITFDFMAGAGGLTFGDATSTIDVHPGTRNVGATTFTLNMLDNDVLGDGRIVNGASVLRSDTGDSMSVNINSSASVSLGAIDLTRDDSSSASISITADELIDIGVLNTSDVSGGGSSAGGINVRGRSLMLGDIDTRAFRADGNANNGGISLTALDPPAFDPDNGLGNSAGENIITLNGTINTNAPSETNTGGNVSVTAVKVVLDSGFALDLSENATAAINAGVAGNGFTEADLFMDMAASGLAADFNVLHDGIPEPSTLALLLCTGLAFGSSRRAVRKAGF